MDSASARSHTAGSAPGRAGRGDQRQGKPGLIEPMGVHRKHRGRGYGTAITVVAAARLQQMGSSSAIVYTPSANVGGVATYASAGFQPRPLMQDLCRDAKAAV